jgi:hypothetical protein
VRLLVWLGNQIDRLAALAPLFSHETKDVNSRFQTLEGDSVTRGSDSLANGLAGRLSYFHFPELVAAIVGRRYDLAPQFHGTAGLSRGGRTRSERRKGEGENRRERQERAATTRSS